MKTFESGMSFFFQKKSTKLKCIKLRGCHVKHKDPATRLKDKKFISLLTTKVSVPPHLVQSSHPSPYSLGTHIKFIAESESDAVLWVSALREAD